MPDIFSVRWEKKVNRQLELLPVQIVRKFYAWVAAVNLVGIRKMRLSSGFHDEPLQGSRAGQRSIRLNRACRAIYVETSTGEIRIIKVLEVHKHAY